MRKVIGVANIKRFAHAPAEDHDPDEIAERHGENEKWSENGKSVGALGGVKMR
jgi:hypothetical protein